MTRATIAAGAVFVVTACGGNGAPRAPAEDPAYTPPSAEISELELRPDGIDRFASCPPLGELGQPWVPTPVPWAPPPDASATTPVAPPIADRSRTESAVEATHREFRSCQRRTLVRGASPDGHIAIVMRIAPDGHVAKVEELAACEVLPEAITCMMQVAAKVHFNPPGPGGDTVVVPSTFSGREGLKQQAPSRNDSYTASAYLTIEGARPMLHACEEALRGEGRPVAASGTFTLSVGAEGRVTNTRIEPWSGERPVVDCAARALAALQFTAPPGGKGFVIARLNFNPRQAAR